MFAVRIAALCSPCSAKTIATYATYPLIIAKVRMQAENSSNQGLGMIAIIYHVWRTEGIAGLYKGVSAQIVKSVIASALMFTVKEKLVDLALSYLPPPPPSPPPPSASDSGPSSGS